MIFDLPPGPYMYRSLKRSVRGADVYALQSGLSGLLLDGDFGPLTERRVRTFQAAQGLVSDGIAGPKTQLAVAFENLPAKHGPEGLAKGLFESESGGLVGNHSKLYSDRSRDFGIVQDNLPEYDANLGFDVPGRIAYYFTMLYRNFERYRRSVHVPTDRRAWELAAGWWNRPAWTDKLAAGGRLTDAQSTWIEGYVARITRYVQW